MQVFVLYSQHLAPSISNPSVTTHLPSLPPSFQGLELLQAGSVFGKTAVMYDVPQLFSVRALTPCQLLRLSKPAFTALLRAFPGDAGIIVNHLRKVRRGGSGVARGVQCMTHHIIVHHRDAPPLHYEPCLSISLLPPE